VRLCIIRLDTTCFGYVKPPSGCVEPMYIYRGFRRKVIVSGIVRKKLI